MLTAATVSISATTAVLFPEDADFESVRASALKVLESSLSIRSSQSELAKPTTKV